MKKILTVTAMLVTLAAATAPSARGDISFGIRVGIPVPAVVVPVGPVCPPAPPVCGPPVIYAPPAVYYHYGPAYPRHYRHRGGYARYGHRDYGYRDHGYGHYYRKHVRRDCDDD